MYTAFYPELNFFSKQREDLFAYFLLGGLGPQSVAYQAVELFVFLLGLVLVFRSTCRVSVIEQGASILAISVLLLSVRGIDILSLKLCWYPWLLWSFSNLYKRRNIYALVALVAVSAFWIVSSGALAAFGILCAFLWLVSRTLSANETTQDFPIGTILLFLVLIAVSVVAVPVFEMPNYPVGARVAPISWLSFRDIPLIGPWLAPYPVVPESYRVVVKAYMLRLVVCGAVLLSVTTLIRPISKLIWSAVACVALVTVFVLEAKAQVISESIRPFQILRGIIPGLAVEDFPWLSLPLMLLPLGLGILANLKGWRIFIASAALLIASIGSAVFIPNPPMAFLRVVPSDVSSRSEQMHFSPSSYVLDLYGEWIAEKGADYFNDAHFKLLNPGMEFSVQMNASRNTEELQNLFDGGTHKRWSTKGPQQNGDFVLVVFDRPISLAKIKLELGEYASDFPRGLSVAVSEDGERFSPVFYQEDWQGSLRWSDDGFPYFGSQSDIDIVFPEEYLVKALRLEQAGQPNSYDWSIGELKLFSRTEVQ